MKLLTICFEIRLQNHTSTTPLEDLAAGRAVNSSNQCLKVFVQRDYSEGTLVKFQTRFPSELEDRVSLEADIFIGMMLEFIVLCMKCRTCTKLVFIVINKIERQAFEYTVNQLNAIYAEAEKAGCSTYCEGCMACLTAYLVYLCTETHYEKCLRKVAKFVVEQNERVYAPRGLLITDPTERGLRVVSFTT
uniref:Ras modification protein ERF4 n=2 Tax=Timema TaxID=61471 RepID=A0A7R8VIB8_TIMDO|nr:unnamed protein product [Timema douglasi]